MFDRIKVRWVWGVVNTYCVIFVSTVAIQPAKSHVNTCKLCVVFCRWRTEIGWWQKVMTGSTWEQMNEVADIVQYIRHISLQIANFNHIENSCNLLLIHSSSYMCCIAESDYCLFVSLRIWIYNSCKLLL